MQKLSILQDRLRDITANKSALWFSGGMDSRLLMEVIIAEDLPCCIFRFDDGWSREQKRTVYQAVSGRDISLYSYRAGQFLLMGDGKQASLAGFYAIGPNYWLPIVRDFVPGQRHLDAIPFEVTDTLPISYPTLIVGSRQGDRHYSVGTPWPGPEVECGPCTVYSPIYDWTDEEVAEGLEHYGVTYQKPPDELDTGNIAICYKCLAAVQAGGLSCSQPEPVWKPEDNLKLFRQMIGV